MTKDDFIALVVGKCQTIGAIAGNKETDLEYAKALRKCLNDIIEEGVQQLSEEDGGDPDCPEVPPPPSQ